MLIQFSCPYYANITLFGEVALQLLQVMGHSGQVPGAIGKEDVAAARDHLKKFITRTAETAEDEDKVSLRKRAIPLLPLFEAAVEHECAVYWE